jgi:hypothetical protein
MNNIENICYRTGQVITCVVATPFIICAIAVVDVTILISCVLVGPLEYILTGKISIAEHIVYTCCMTFRDIFVSFINIL